MESEGSRRCTRWLIWTVFRNAHSCAIMRNRILKKLLTVLMALFLTFVENRTVEAAKPGQYIHSTLIGVPTKIDGIVSFILSVDNFSRFCFQPSLTKELIVTDVEKHLHEVLTEIKKKHPGVKPKIFLSYVEEVVSNLSSSFTNQCIIEYNPEQADRIALPEVNSILDATFNKD